MNATPDNLIASLPENSDWPKRTWDIWAIEPTGLVLADTVARLANAMSFEHLEWSQQDEAIRNLERLPVWQAAPRSLLDEVARRRAATQHT